MGDMFAVIVASLSKEMNLINGSIIQFKMKPEDIIPNTKADILESLVYELQRIVDKETENEVYFHDIVSTSIDSNTPQDRADGMALIDHTGNEEHADEGVLDKSSLDRFIVTMAYECLHQEVFNDDFFQNPLQDKLNNETITVKQAHALLADISEYKSLNNIGNPEYIDSETQIYLTLGFPLSIKDFEQPYFSEKALVDLTDSIKIFTSNKELHQNAIVIEGTNKNPVRVYLMNRDKDIDIREFFKYNPSINQMDYSLNPKDYIDGQIRKDFENKQEFIYYINRMACALTELTC